MSSAGDTPLLHQLECLKVDSYQLKIVDQMSSKWKEMALALKFDHNVMERITCNTCNYGCEESCRQMFSRWLKGEAGQPITWERLIIALNDIKYGTLASELTLSLSP